MTAKASQFLNDKRADEMTALSMAAQSVVSKKAGNRLSEAVKRLRSGLPGKKRKSAPTDSEHASEVSSVDRDDED